MAIDKIASVAGSAAAQALEGGKAKFGKTMEQVGGKAAHAGKPQPQTQKTVPVNTVEQPGRINPQAKVAGINRTAVPQKVTPVSKPRLESAAKVLDQVGEAQARMDRILQMAQSGRTFSPAELIALQAQVCSASQEIDLAGKVVEKATGGVKQVLQTQV